MQRLVWALLAGVPSAASAQAEAAAQLWRLALTTLPIPPALGRGSSAAFWNPAQDYAPQRAVVGIEFIQAPIEVGASGLLAAAQVRVHRVGYLGLIYGRMQVNELVRTTVSPDPQPGGISYFTHALALTWARRLAGMTVGAVAGVHQDRLEYYHTERWTLDAGLERHVGPSLRLALATHFLSPGGGPAPARDIFGGLAYRVWQGEVWAGGREATVELRYGIAFAHGFAPDHAAGLGVDLGDVLGLDALIAREGGWAGPGWRPVGGLRLRVGRYRLTVARDAGLNDIGSAFRVGIEARLDD
ncbi:MAG TPA: hypothetical protein VNI61_04695 [Gemmatimonadales bacterium]|nr:hypothetical protein [Gemmatimonadales bacterium]